MTAAQPRPWTPAHGLMQHVPARSFSDETSGKSGERRPKGADPNSVVRRIQIQDDNGGFVAEIGVQDNRKYDVVRVDARTILDPGGYLVFKKAKAFGIHTGMYRLATGGLSQLRGQRATFYWYAD
jgi:hypothetical protein